MSVTDALASPQHRVRQTHPVRRRHPHRRHGGAAGPALLHRPGTSGFGDQSLADIQKGQNLGSFTLGPGGGEPAGAVQRRGDARLAAASGARPPRSTRSSTDRASRSRSPSRPASRSWNRASPNTLANAMSKDDQGGGTSAGAAAVGRLDSCRCRARPVPPSRHRSSGFLGFTNNARRRRLRLRRLADPRRDLLVPAAPCGDGDLFGGNEPARTWYNAIKPIVDNFPPPALPPVDQKYARGSPNGRFPMSPG